MGQAFARRMVSASRKGAVVNLSSRRVGFRRHIAGVDHAGELNESVVPGILDDASVILSDFGIEKRLSESFQLRQRALSVDPY
jgi:hypothetical protein